MRCLMVLKKEQENEGMTSLVGSLGMVCSDNDKMTQENAVRIVMTAAENSQPPIDTNEVVTIWNSIMSKP